MNTNRHLITSGILFTLVLFIWPIFMGIAQPQGAGIERLDWITDNLTLFKVQFFFAFLIAPSLVYLMTVQFIKRKTIDSPTAIVGFMFLTGYLILNSIAYGSQITIVPGLLNSGLIDHANIWYFESDISVTYFIDQMGYCFWAIGTLLLFGTVVKDSGIVKYIGIIYTVSAFLSILAFIGLLINNTFLNTTSLISGILLLPIGIMSIIWGVQKQNDKTN